MDAAQPLARTDDGAAVGTHVPPRVDLPDTAGHDRAAARAALAARLVADLVDVPVHLPGTDGYAAHTATPNTAVVQRPLLVTVPCSPHDVAHVLRVAAAHGVPVAVRGTGHGASEPLDDALLLSTAALHHLVVLPALGSAHVGAGVRWSEVVAAAAPYGLAPVCGSAPGVGVVGYLTGGGHGPLARAWGVSSDRVRAFDVVTGDGVVRRATATDEPDLFWALRGGRGALGVVVAVDLELVDQPEILAGAVWFAADDVERVLHAWATWAPTLPPEATTSAAVLRLPPVPGVPEALAGRTTLAVRFTWTGDPVAGRAVLAPLRDVAPALLDTVDVVPYAAVGDVHADPDAPMPVHDTHLLLEDLGPEACERLVDLVGPASSCAQVVVEVRHLGGAAARQPDVPDALPSRTATWCVCTVGLAAPGEAGAAVVADARRIVAGLAPWTRPGALPNFTSGHGPAWAARVYPPATRARLAEVSRRYDPDGVLLAGHAFRTP